MVSMQPAPPAPTSRREPVGQSLTVAAVAHRLGVSPTTLRTWDRRHGIGPTEHEAGTHRRYTPTDLARLMLMRRLALDGVGVAEAAQVAKDTPVQQLPVVDPRSAADVRAAGPGLLRRANGLADSGAGSRGEGQPGPPIRVEDAVRGLLRAAKSLDAGAVSGIISESIQRRGVVPTWDALIVPALRTIGSQWERTGVGVDVEHLASECVLGVLRQHTAHASAHAVNPRPVLLACSEEEQHSLPLHATAAALAERHVGSRILGARVPTSALSAAMKRLGPSGVLLWSLRPETGNPAQLTALPDLHPAPVIALGGGGWPLEAGRAAPGKRIVPVHDLAESVAVLANAAGA